MLVVANASQKQKDSYDRRKKVGANSASDIWSLGCLLFELLTGSSLLAILDESLSPVLTSSSTYLIRSIPVLR